MAGSVALEVEAVEKALEQVKRLEEELQRARAMLAQCPSPLELERLRTRLAGLPHYQVELSYQLWRLGVQLAHALREGREVVLDDRFGGVAGGG